MKLKITTIAAAILATIGTAQAGITILKVRPAPVMQVQPRSARVSADDVFVMDRWHFVDFIRPWEAPHNPPPKYVHTSCCAPRGSTFELNGYGTEFWMITILDGEAKGCSGTVRNSDLGGQADYRRLNTTGKL
jgi:hypothetical protein